MSRRHFSALLIASLVMAGLVALLIPVQSDKDTAGGTILLESAKTEINDVTHLRITGGGGAPVSNVSRSETAWTIDELDGYPADWRKLKTLLTSLAEARILETKTSNPEYYSRLGVEDISAEGAQSTLLEFSLGGGDFGVISGNEETSRGGQYVRMANQARSLLIDRELNLDPEPISWADDEIIDIGSALVAAMEISHPDGDSIRIHKVSADETDFLLVNMPEGRELVSSWSVNSLANNFSSLRMDAVKPSSGTDYEDPVKVRLLTFSGLEIHAEIFEQDERGWISLVASSPESSVSLAEDSLVEDPSADDPLAEAAGEQVAEQAESIRRKTSGWIYRLPASKFDSMTKRLEALLKSADENSES